MLADFPSELQPLYETWLSENPDKAGQLASIISNTAAEIRALIASNPTNTLDEDETKIPLSLLRQAETLIYFTLSMEMGVSIAPEANQAMIRAEITLRTLVYGRYLVSGGSSASQPSPLYNPEPERPTNRTLPVLAALLALFLGVTAAPAAWVKPGQTVSDAAVYPTFAPSIYSNTTTTLFGHLQGIDAYLGSISHAYPSVFSSITVSRVQSPLFTGAGTCNILICPYESASNPEWARSTVYLRGGLSGAEYGDTFIGTTNGSSDLYAYSWIYGRQIFFVSPNSISFTSSSFSAKASSFSFDGPFALGMTNNGGFFSETFRAPGGSTSPKNLTLKGADAYAVPNNGGAINIVGGDNAGGAYSRGSITIQGGSIGLSSSNGTTLSVSSNTLAISSDHSLFSAEARGPFAASSNAFVIRSQMDDALSGCLTNESDPVWAAASNLYARQADLALGIYTARLFAIDNDEFEIHPTNGGVQALSAAGDISLVAWPGTSTSDYEAVLLFINYEASLEIKATNGLVACGTIAITNGYWHGLYFEKPAGTTNKQYRKTR
ncbi:MAG TPA: hypothetical protein PK634_14000 [Kiritimatiellia bacterium]|nr:hypothetical protein [Kiritimatiellia bacterium]